MFFLLLLQQVNPISRLNNYSLVTIATNCCQIKMITQDPGPVAFLYNVYAPDFRGQVLIVFEQGCMESSFWATSLKSMTMTRLLLGYHGNHLSQKGIISVSWIEKTCPSLTAKLVSITFKKILFFRQLMLLVDTNIVVSRQNYSLVTIATKYH